MVWQQARRQYPDRWLLIDTIKAHTEADRRVVEDVAVVEAFDDSVEAFKRYAEVHRLSPDRELYVFHTSRESLDITERRWLGIRGLQ